MKKIELVFRSIGERTAELALGYALQHIRPQRVHLIENVTPPSRSVQKMLEIEYDADVVVFMDADCLILEDLQPFLHANERPFVDAYVWDKFRGWVHCGLHIKRIDVVNAMKQVRIPDDDLRYILRSEARTHNLALKQLGAGKMYRGFKILHDFGQFHRHIFAKYALRELRSREPEKRAKLNQSMRVWSDDDQDCQVAQHAVAYTRQTVRPDASVAEIAAFIADLPNIARRELSALNISEKSPFTLSEICQLHTIPFEHLPDVEFENVMT